MSEMTQPTPGMFDEIKQALKELTQQSKETDRRFQETDRKFQETDRKFQETDRMFQETDRRFKETDRKFQETDRMFQETDLQFKETERQMKETFKKIGELGNRLGEFVEGMIAPAAVRLFQQRGIEVMGLNRNMERNNSKLGLAAQIDLLAVNGDACVVIEVKSNLSVDDVNEHLQRMEKFKALFHEYADKQAYGAVAAMVLPDDVARYAYRKGLFVIAQRGDTAEILNNESFKPAAW
jgi:hypothetical protein